MIDQRYFDLLFAPLAVAVGAMIGAYEQWLPATCWTVLVVLVRSVLIRLSIVGTRARKGADTVLKRKSS
jgi:putative effector of murein hydrolase LrgA (UPF0299 family)